MTEQDNRVRLGQIKNLLMLAMADGRVDENELAMIAMVAVREGMSVEQFEAVIDDPESVSIELPQDRDTRDRYLRDMIELMMIDGEIHETELNICQVYAVALGYNPQTVEDSVIAIINEMK